MEQRVNILKRHIWLYQNKPRTISLVRRCQFPLRKLLVTGAASWQHDVCKEKNYLTKTTCYVEWQHFASFPKQNSV